MGSFPDGDGINCSECPLAGHSHLDVISCRCPLQSPDEESGSSQAENVTVSGHLAFTS